MLTDNEKQTAKILLLSLIENGLPVAPSVPEDAYRQNDKITITADLMEEFLDILKQRYAQNLRVIRGDTLGDEHFKRVEESERQKWLAVYNGTDKISQFQKEAAEEGRLKKEELQARAAKIKQAQEKHFEYVSRVTGH